MLSNSLFLLLLLAFPVAYKSHGISCSTKSPEKLSSEIMAWEVDNFERKNKHARSLMSLCDQCIKIDTHFTIFESNRPESIRISQQMVDEQLQVLIDRFRGTPFTFVLRSLNRITNETLHDRFIDADIGRRYRKGGYETLNVYFGCATCDSSYATFADLMAVGGPVHFEDGVYNHLDEFPFTDDSTLGTTLVHEVGHWLGLLHTFEVNEEFRDNPCHEDNPNDYVSDTPVQINSTEGCPENVDTCPDLSGNDPIHNYMDYSDDACMSEFTPGQINRMFSLWSLYRVQDESCFGGYSLFEFELVADAFVDEINWQLESLDGSFFENPVTNQYFTSYNDTLQGFEGVDPLFFFDQGNIFRHDICIPPEKEYRFTIFDAFGDGLEEGLGSYRIRLNGNIIREGSVFATRQETTFSTTPAPATPSPTPMPTPMPTPAPVSTPDMPSFTFCFSGVSTVNVLDRGLIEMKDLKVGDFVQVDKKQRFEHVYSFGHRDESVVGYFLQFLPSQLELSESHLVYVIQENQGEGGGVFLPASMVKVGDRFVHVDAHDDDNVTNMVVVEGIRPVSRKGVYAPFTPSGTIVVNGILSSNYISLQTQSHILLLKGPMVSGMDRLLKTPFTFHWLSHAFQTPHRFWCHWLAQHDDVMDRGLSRWSSNSLLFATWFLNLSQSNTMWSLFLHFVVMIPLIATIALLHGVERCIGLVIDHVTIKTLLLLLVLSIGTAILWRRSKKSTK